ncbi:MAG: hypothetical protein ACXW0F_12370 [Gaiellaceae bacterium]
MVWELVFMLVILKIPVVYLCAVVWWAIKAEPKPFEGAARLAPLPRYPSCDWRRRRSLGLRRRPLPRDGRGGRPAYARGQVGT